MITSREDLRLFLQEDAKRNGFAKGYWQYLFRLICRSENALAYRYLRTLRKCEYHSNNHSLIHKLAYYYYIGSEGPE